MNDVIPSIHGAVMRGTTPTIIYDLGFDVSEVTSLKLYFMQGNKVVFTKELTDCTAEEGLIYTQLTQEDTYKLSAKKRLEIRCRFKRNDSPVVGTIASYYDVIDSGKPEMELDPQPVPTEPPAYIVITVLPNTLEYEDGDDISIDGIEVRAYYEDGTEWGIVPFEELDWNPKVAEGVQSDIYVKGGIRCIKISCDTYSDANFFIGFYYCPNAVFRGKSSVSSPDYNAYYFYGRQTIGDIYLTRYNDPEYGMRLYGVCMDDPAGTREVVSFYDNVLQDGFGYNPGPSGVSGVFGSVGRYLRNDMHTDYEWIPESTENPASKSFAGAVPEGSSITQDITVSWDRGDGVVLTDDYEITVSEESQMWTDGDGVYALKITYERTWVKGYWALVSEEGYAYINPSSLGLVSGKPCTVGGHVGNETTATLFITKYGNTLFGVRVSGDNNEFHLYYWNNDRWEGIGAAGRTTYTTWEQLDWVNYLTYIPTSTKDPTTVDPGDLHPL